MIEFKLLEIFRRLYMHRTSECYVIGVIIITSICFQIEWVEMEDILFVGSIVGAGLMR